MKPEQRDAIDAPVITIDGPSGVGKGTLGILLAKKLNWNFLDSGALYRILAIAAQKHGVDLNNAPALEILATYMDVQFELTQGHDEWFKVVFEGENVTLMMRKDACGEAASKIAVLPSVRQALLARQRKFKAYPGLIADGRDMGTVVFPEAALKIFLTASAKERALRRYKQLKGKGINVNLAEILTDISKRDARDIQRPIAPLVAAEDAIVLETTDLSIEQVFAAVMAVVVERSLVVE